VAAVYVPAVVNSVAKCAVLDAIAGETEAGSESC